MSPIIVEKFHWVHTITYFLSRNSFFKSQKIEKYLHWTSILLGECSLMKLGQIRLIFETFEVWKTIFSIISNVMESVEFFQNTWAHCRYSSHLSPGVGPFPQSKITKNFGIYTHLGWNNLREEGIARAKMITFLKAFIHTLPEEILMFSQKCCSSPKFKIWPVPNSQIFCWSWFTRISKGSNFQELRKQTTNNT